MNFWHSSGTCCDLFHFCVWFHVSQEWELHKWTVFNCLTAFGAFFSPRSAFFFLCIYWLLPVLGLFSAGLSSLVTWYCSAALLLRTARAQLFADCLTVGDNASLEKNSYQTWLSSTDHVKAPQKLMEYLMIQDIWMSDWVWCRWSGWLVGRCAVRFMSWILRTQNIT